MKHLLYISIFLYFFTNCNQNIATDITEENFKLTPKTLHKCNVDLESAIVNDFFSPPVASRIYVYPNIAAYECIISKEKSYNSILNITDSLNEEELLLMDKNKNKTSVYAFYFVAKNMVYSSNIIDQAIVEFDSLLKDSNMPETRINKIKQLAQKISKHVLNFAKDDGYNQMRSASKYLIQDKEYSWKPTPPDYSDALEPHWSELRSFTLDSSSQFRPIKPTEINFEKNSKFYTELIEVYNAVNNLDSNTVEIAKFWDCNPIVPKHHGHLTFSEKKLTPGGHWVNIGRNSMIKESFDIKETSYSYTLLSIAIHDAFISCWDEKYHSNYIRPITIIQNNIDSKWSPILLTPNFPEYPSGHSVVSSSASTILTYLFGENYSFIDSTEVPYGMSPRLFTSFYHASEEAAISRLYGGIHFRPAIDNGIEQGKKIGKHVLSTINLKNEKK